MVMRNQDGTEIPVSEVTGTEDDLAYLLGGTYICTRVWEAWEAGTMTEEDFTPADTPDVRADLIAWRDAAVAAERQRLSAGLNAVGDRFKNAGIFARCVISEIRELIREPTP
jgi:hypothetical protein